MPDAGPENPFQYQLICLLRNNGFEVEIGKKRKIGSIYKAVNQFRPEVIYFDWVHSFIIGKSFFWSCMKSAFFLAEIVYLYSVRRIPLIHTLHNIQNHNEIRLTLEQLIYGFFLRRCTKIRVYSDDVKEKIIHRFKISPDRIFIIQDVPFHHYYPNVVTKMESRKHFCIPEKDFVFLFFGKIRPYKGLESLILSFIKTSKNYDYLIIAGDSPDQKYLAGLKFLASRHSKIIWYDRFIKDKEIQYFFNAADIVVLPFVKIDHSGSMDLAMSFVKPVITLKTETSVKLLAHQKDLLFVNKENLEDCLIRSHTIDRKKIGEQNLRIADDSNYQELLSLFQKV